MYTIIREVTFKTIADAVRGMPIAGSFRKYFKDTHNIDIKLMRPVGGYPSHIRFVFELESLDVWVSNNQKFMEDPSYHKLLNEIGPLVDGSKTHDEIWM